MMPLRSLLFVPGDQEKRFDKAVSCGADAVILDLEDAVTHSSRSAARAAVNRFLRAQPSRGKRQVKLFVRVNKLRTDALCADLESVELSLADYANHRDATGLASMRAHLRRTGWLGKLAIHPDQITTINEGFMPTAGDIRQAEAIIAAFETSLGGVISLDGQMFDQPHLKQARYVLSLRDLYA